MTITEAIRKAHITRLKLILWLRRLEFDIEPVSSPKHRAVTLRYAKARSELFEALLKDINARENKGAL